MRRCAPCTKCKVVLLIFGLGLAEEESLGEGVSVGLDGSFQRIKIGWLQPDGAYVEIFSSSSFQPVEGLHPSVKIRMLPPIEKFGAMPSWFVKSVYGGDILRLLS